MTRRFLEVRDLTKEYPTPDGTAVMGLHGFSFDADRGEMVGIEGPSGSGKTTFLHLLAALLRPTRGEILFDGINDDLLFQNEGADKWRAQSVGMVFQNMNLLPDFSVWENVLIAAKIAGMTRQTAQERAKELLTRLGLADRMNRRPANLSLGEQQRGAVARAVVHRPSLVLADEPTASLDAENAAVVLDLLTELCAESRSLLLVATHDEAVKRRFRALGRMVAIRRSNTEALP